MASYKTSNASVYVPATVKPPTFNPVASGFSKGPNAVPFPGLSGGVPYSQWSKTGDTIQGLQGGNIQNAINTGQYGPPTTIPSGGGGGGGGTITASSLTAQQPVNLTTGSFGGGSAGVGTSGTGGSGAGITGGTLGYNASVAGSIGNEYTRDANGNWVLNQQDPNAQVDNLPDYIKQNIPQKESLYAQPEYQQAQQQYEQARQRQRQYSDQIAAITNIANAKALSLQGQGRGIPEAIIGGQQAQIYKEAAIQALPIQSQLAIAQGDTQAAQEHLKTLTEYLTESVQNKFEADKMRYSAVVGYMTEKEKQYTTQLLSEKKALTDAQSEAFDMLAKAGITSGAAYNEIQRAKSVKDVAMVKARYAGAGGGLGLTPVQVLSFTNQVEDNYRANPAVQNFTQLVNFGVPSVINEIQSSPSSIKDTVLMRTLAKITDPTTGVREGEYETFASATGALNRLMVLPKEWVGAGRLTPLGRSQMTELIKTRFDAAKSEYTAQYDYYNSQVQKVGATLPPAFSVSKAPTSATPPNDETLQNEWLSLQSGASPQTVNYYAPVSDFFGGLLTMFK